jgi:hypothetical protein
MAGYSDFNWAKELKDHLDWNVSFYDDYREITQRIEMEHFDVVVALFSLGPFGIRMIRKPMQFREGVDNLIALCRKRDMKLIFSFANESVEDNSERWINIEGVSYYMILDYDKWCVINAVNNVLKTQ